ncbi:MAG TPA: hypothetical protein VN736_02855 [Candidatus Limnocylindrales bacterium]|jgi:hypothetical protein|nr:hypothetical protein [Candidatus Limnocylindrales bacterium]
MNSKFMLGFAALALGVVASAKTYNITLEKSEAGTTELSAGSYRLDVNGDKAVISKGKVSAENPVKVETVDRRYDNTTVKYATDGGKMRIQEIRIGGTKTKLVFTEATPLP